MFVKVCLFLALAAIAMSAPVDEADAKKAPLSLDQHWVKFKTDFNRSYKTPEEEKKRFEIFKGNFNRIEAHNKKYDAGEVSYSQGINDFADLTQEEFAETHLMHLPKNNH